MLHFYWVRISYLIIPITFLLVLYITLLLPFHWLSWCLSLCCISCPVSFSSPCISKSDTLWSWIVIYSVVKLLGKIIKGLITLLRESFTKSEWVSHAKDIKAYWIFRAHYHVVVSTSRIRFRWCPSSIWIPIINRFILKVQQEIKEEHCRKVLKNSESLFLTGVHIGVDIHQEH